MAGDDPLWEIGQRVTRIRARLMSPIACPMASLLVHLGMLHWVYRVPFLAADASPVLLGLAVALARVRPTRPALARV